MKLSHLYSNKPDVFEPIRFNDGLNIVLAKIEAPKAEHNFGHNLGKTLLIDVIDFALLKGISKKHLFKRRSDLFSEFVFFLEIKLAGSQNYLTIRRSAKEPTKIAFKRHDSQYQDFNSLPENEWDHWRESFDKSVKLLDSILAFDTIKPWTYRKGVSYFLRTQKDYNDVFQLAKFGRGLDIDWKPYMAKVLGFDDEVLLKKYRSDIELKKLNSESREIQSEIEVKSSDYAKLKAAITIKKDEINDKLDRLDLFDFHSAELSIVKDLADTTETKIAEINEQLYNHRHDLSQIERSLSEEIDFDLEEIKEVFKETQLTFPEQLAKDYDDLIAFNHRILNERQSFLRNQAESLKGKVKELERENASLSEERKKQLQILGGTDSLQKYKQLQSRLDNDRAQLSLMQTKIAKLEGVLELQEQIRVKKQDIEHCSVTIEKMILDNTPLFSAIQRTFNSIISQVLHKNALLYLNQNDSGNIDFHAEITDIDLKQMTDEDRGTSFRQMLCIAFDLSVLIHYADNAFFHFVYHDGALERLQNKLKISLVDIIRKACEDSNIQFIMSALSEDLENVFHTPEEIILKLDDSGDSGRLFKMSSF